MTRRRTDTDKLRLLWLTALLSGVYKQAQSALVEYIIDDVSLTDHPEYCCIDVLCDVGNIGNWMQRDPTTFRIGRQKFEAEIPEQLLPHFGLTPNEQQMYIGMNDAENKNFEEIALAAGS